MYNHNLIEKKWQKYWLDSKTYAFVDSNKPKYYVLDMFPYPSGSGLHVGHPKGYTATDVISRYKKLQGFNVLHPIGWDAFGLPAEQHALQTKHHPKNFTQHNINHFRRQLQSLGFNFDYRREVNTTDPNYYKWTQWIFSKLFEHNLAELRDTYVNWCPKLGTVLANEEIIIKRNKMVSERGEYPVEKRMMRQWVLKITNYADKLLDGLNEVAWPESLKAIQRSWIGKNNGAIINFVSDNNITLEVFTTRADTLYGVTYIAVAPENELVDRLTIPKYKNSVIKYIKQALAKSDLVRKDEEKSKTGVFTGSYAFHPLTKEKIPIFIADYVLNTYGTSVVMGVPAHDARDYAFALKNHLKIKYIIATHHHKKPFLDDGPHIDSPLVNGLNNVEANGVIINYLIKNKLGRRHVVYHMKDWIFSRQRYWGEPFPIIYDQNNRPTLIKQLPVLLPYTKNIKPTKNVVSPLAGIKSWNHVKINGKTYHHDINTMPQWAGSCWYYLGYLLKQNDSSYIDLNSSKAKKLFQRWLPVDLYIGGQEHAVLHLLYARFWHRFLYDIGVVPTKEPFQHIINQGMILGPNNEKMSKSRGNVVNPDQIIKSHGADALRLYELFMGPITASLPWTESGLDGMRKWLDRVHRLFTQKNKIVDDPKILTNNLDRAYHVFLKEVNVAIENHAFNVAISKMMVYINACYHASKLFKPHIMGFTIVLSCFAPHLAEELWHNVLKQTSSIYNDNWPKFICEKTTNDIITLPIQENGKFRHTINIDVTMDEQTVIAKAKAELKVINFIKNRNIKKIIYVKHKILNFIL